VGEDESWLIIADGARQKPQEGEMIIAGTRETQKLGSERLLSRDRVADPPVATGADEH